ncbi:MAG: LPD28 domain-containing protein [Bifidobacterium sp.]|uniref:LPD28 domain-containing protein n=1 Tax=Bifidobacterium sp. TaxID=41200 RepID=UPI0039E95182
MGVSLGKPDANETEGLYSMRLEIEARKAPVAAFYSDVRLNHEQVPHGYYRYSIRETDGGSGEPATIERHLLVNHLMDILTTENLDSLIEEHDGYLNISDYDYDDSRSVSFPKSILSPRYFHD